MAKFLYVGDPHTQVSNLAESEMLLTFVEQTALEQQCDSIVFLGDQHHTHAIIRAEVQDFWNRWLFRLGAQFGVVALTGNHDMTGDHHSRVSSMRIFEGRSDNVTIVSDGLKMGPIAFLAYEHDQTVFIEKANAFAAMGAKILVCHQSFSGSKFENGYYDPQGINPDLLNVEQVISGHIHLGQEFGKVWHPGTAMWLTASDANQTKGVWVVEHGADGKILNKVMFDTSAVVTPIISVQWREGEKPPEIADGIRATIELVGTSEWIAQNKAEFKGKTAIKSTVTDNAKLKGRRAGKSLLDFLESEFELVSSVDRQKFLAFVKEQDLV